MKKTIILIISISLLTGCNYVELNDLAIASSIGIDYDKKNQSYDLTAQIINVKSGDSGSAEESTIIYEAKGKTMSEAVSNFSIRYPKNVYFGHLEMCVLGKSAVENKLSNIFDYFIRDSESKSSCYTLIAKDKTAREILNPKNEKSENFPTEDLKSVLIDGTNKTGTINKITLEEFLGYTLEKGIDPVIPTVNIVGSNKESSSNTIIDSTTVISKNKVIENMSKNSSIIYNTIKNNYSNTVIDLKYNDDYISFIIYNPKVNIDTKVENNIPIFDIDIDIEIKSSELNERIDLNDKKLQMYFENEINKTFKRYFDQLIDYSRNNNVDPIGLGNMLYKSYPEKYKNIKNKDIYSISKINMNVKSKMYVHGNINKGAL